MNLTLFANSILLGFGLSMDAFSVSVANGLKEKEFRLSSCLRICGTFALFQFLMPLIGWWCVRTVIETLSVVRKFLPIASFVLLSFVGVKMIVDNIFKGARDEHTRGGSSLILQGIATSLDALSVGITISEYGIDEAIGASLIIGLVTLIVCYSGVVLGSYVRVKTSSKMEIIGGVILILIGAEILITSLI